MQRDDKETTKSMTLFSKLDKAAHELIKGFWLPPLEELGQNLVMEKSVEKVQDNTNH
jgi:hypothetical protein